jgi:hypothetical protein
MASSAAIGIVLLSLGMIDLGLVVGVSGVILFAAHRFCVWSFRRHQRLRHPNDPALR